MPNRLSAECETFYLAPDAKDAATLLVDLGTKTLVENAPRATRAYRNASLFEGYELANLDSWGSNTQQSQVYSDEEFKQIKNKAKPLALAFVGKSFGNDDVMPQFTTQGGDYDQTLKAKTLDKVIAEEFDEQQGMFHNVHDAHRHGATIAASATGEYYAWSIVYENSTQPQLEVDDGLTVGVIREQRYGKPIVVCRVVELNPETAIARFGKKFYDQVHANVETSQAPFEAGSMGLDNLGSDSFVSERRTVRVIMGWAMGEHGRELFVLKDGTILRDREWDKQRAPYAHWSYCRELGGRGSSCITDEIYETSLRQNRILHDVDHQERETPGVLWAVQENSTIKAQLEQTRGIQVVTTPGDPKAAMEGVAVTKFSPQSLQLEGLYDATIHGNARIAANHAAGEKATGTTSGVQEHYAASYYTENFADQERRAIKCRTRDTAEIFVWSLQELADRNYEKWVGDKKTREIIKGSDLDLDLDRYVISIRAVGETKESPLSSLKKVEGWVQDPTVQYTGADLNKFLETYDDEDAAGVAFGLEEWAGRQVDRWLSMDEAKLPDAYMEPEISMGLEGIARVQRVVNLAFLKAREDDVPEARIKFFEQFLGTCVRLSQNEQKRMAELGAMQAPQGGVQ
jgi:hypothetical protein